MLRLTPLRSFARHTTSLLVFLLASHLSPLYANTIEKHRVLVLTDIEADPDDSESMVRLLLYSNQIDIEGLVATTSVWQKNRTAAESIKKIIRAYGKVQANLSRHEAGFPKEKTLQDKVKSGLALYGMQGVGEGKDSEGSDWIIHVLEEKDPRPLWVSVWGGVNTLAQALYKIQHQYSEDDARRLIAKLRVYTISDQDDSGIWIRNHFPDLFYVVSPGDDYGRATWNGIMTDVEGADNSEISNTWIAQNIQQGHGPLGAAYPDVSWGMEGDTPSWLSLIPNGLQDPEHPNWGGWGGRYEYYQPDMSERRQGPSKLALIAETRKIWADAVDHYTPYHHAEFGRTVTPSERSFADNKVSLWRWRKDFQNDFAARMDWCVKSYRDANHPPVPALSGSDQLTVNSGEGFTLDASNSSDPDGDSLSFLWFNYPEAGSYKKWINIEGAENSHSAYIVAPHVEKKETAHFILKVSDKGEPSLSRYKRIIVTIMPKK